MIMGGCARSHLGGGRDGVPLSVVQPGPCLILRLLGGARNSLATEPLKPGPMSAIRVLWGRGAVDDGAQVVDDLRE